jgi:two-component system nitrogen regulation response regulator GlnG
MDGTVLVADDDRTIRTVLTQALTRAGCKVHATSSMVTLMRWVEEGKGDLVISDVVMPDGNGLEALPKISQQRPGLPVIVISAQNTIMTAIQAAEKDAYDYLPKPFDLPDLMKRAARALDVKRRTGAARKAVETTAAADDLPLVGRTPAMQALYRLVARIMNTDIAVLITGESGTGKSLIARAIHDFSDRRTLPFVVVSAADLAPLDGPATVLARGEFRQDLYYRLSGVTVSVPSLRERVDDIALLAEHFLARADREGIGSRRLGSGAMDLVRAYSWPGNVRQLENTIRRLTVTQAEEDIGRAEVEQVLGNQPEIEPVTGRGDGEKLSAAVGKHLRRHFDLHGGVLPPPGLYQRVLREIEYPLIEIALDATGGNQAKCADLLGINRNTLRKKITDLDIRVTRRRKLM